MAGASGSTSRNGSRPLFSGAGSREAGLRLLASFPDLDRMGIDRPAAIVPSGEPIEQRSIPRIGWGSITILAVVAVAVCTAAWWIDRGPIDPGAAEIERARLAERATGTPPPTVRTATKIKKSMKR